MVLSIRAAALALSRAYRSHWINHNLLELSLHRDLNGSARLKGKRSNAGKGQLPSITSMVQVASDELWRAGGCVS